MKAEKESGQAKNNHVEKDEKPNNAEQKRKTCVDKLLIKRCTQNTHVEKECRIENRVEKQEGEHMLR